jgi:Universal stress protein family
MFLGSVSNYVTHHAPCSVLIIRADINSNSQSNQTSFLDEQAADIQSKLTANQS